MRHRLAGRKLGRPQSHRKALAGNLLNSLFLYGRILTTISKAKEFRPMAEKLITRAKKGGLANMRIAFATLQQKNIVKKLFEDIAPRFADRKGGYTRIVRLGGSRWDGKDKGKWAARRLGDNGERAIFELLVTKERDEELKLAGIGESATPTAGKKEKAAKAK